jgi:hypothetical protein
MTGITPDDLKTFGSSVAFIIAATIVYIQNRRQEKTVDKVEKTLTTNNGGGHVKDQLDRIEKYQVSLGNKVDGIEIRLNTVDSKFEVMAGRFDNVDTKIGLHYDSVNVRIARLEDKE